MFSPKILNFLISINHYFAHIVCLIKSKFIHYDFVLQPENVMATTKKSTDVKLIDFGLAAKLDPENVVKVTTATAEFAAPEVCDHEPVGFYTDMWAVGVLAYIL